MISSFQYFENRLFLTTSFPVGEVYLLKVCSKVNVSNTSLEIQGPVQRKLSVIVKGAKGH